MIWSQFQTFMQGNKIVDFSAKCYKPRIRSYGLVICDINNNKDSSSSFVYEFISSMSKGRVKVLNCL